MKRCFVRIQEIREYEIMFDAGTTQSLEQAKSDALEILADDPKLRKKEHAALRAALKETLGGMLELAQVG